MTQQSAIYLSGNKRVLYPQIKPFLQDGKRKVLIDLFGGSGTISINSVKDSLFEKVIYNDKATWLFEMQSYLKNNLSLENLVLLNNSYSKNQEDYLKLVDSYNKKPSIEKLFILMFRSNNNQVRFSKKENKFNMTWGDRSPFFPERLKTHSELLKNVDLANEDFGDMIENILEAKNLSGTTVYIDPPYGAGTKVSTATYNEKGWDDNDNTSLLDYCLELQSVGAKVVLSNVFENRGNVHEELIKWCDENKDKFVVHHLDKSYNNSSFRKSSQKTDEVLIVSK